MCGGVQDIVQALGHYDGVVLLGSPGSRKSTLRREVRAALEQQEGRLKGSVVQAAHRTLASVLHRGLYKPGSESPYERGAERDVAKITHMVLEEAPAWGPLVFRNAFNQVGAAVKQAAKGNSPRL